jgi:hypothetical protein
MTIIEEDLGRSADRSSKSSGVGMNCLDFEDGWNELLDARLAGPSDLEHRLEEHAVSCASCRSTSARYHTLRQAIEALGPPPAPSAESSAKLLAVMIAAPVPAPRGPARRLLRFAWVPLATAAALLILARPGGTPRREPIAPSPSTAARPEPYRPIGSALDDARTATIELALEASAPATRIGLEVLGDRNAGGDPASGPARTIDDGHAPPPAELIQSVGERLTERVRPISGSARHAFSFLLGPPPRPPALDSL